MATVVIQRRQGSGRVSYVIHYKHPMTGKTKYYKAFRKLQDAQQATHELRHLLDSGRLHEIEKVRLNPLTFEETAQSLVKQWQQRFVLGKLSKTTIYEYTVRTRVLCRTFGKRLLCEISESELMQYMTEVVQKKSKISANRDLFIIKQVFKHGIEIRSTPEDPAAKIHYLSEKEHERNRFLLPAQIDLLVAASLKTKAKHYICRH